MKSWYLVLSMIVVTLLVAPAPQGIELPVIQASGTVAQAVSFSLDHPLPESSVAPQALRSIDGWFTLMTQDFEGTFPATGWTVFDNDGSANGEYYWDDDDYKPHTGSWSAWCANGGADGLDPQTYYYPNDMQSWMVYGPVDLSAASDAELLFYYWNQSEADYDDFMWTASTNGTNFYGYKVNGDSGGWQFVNFDLTSVPTLGDVTGSSSVWIAFIFNSDSSTVDDGAFVDDVTLQAINYTDSVYLPLVSRQQAIDFQPNPDGYSFPNYGNSHVWSDDLGVADLINMFGAAEVCASGSTPADCVLTSTANSWRLWILSIANGGHCEGMAVTCLRLYKGQPFYTGDTTPGDFQTGALATYDLARSQPVDNYIMYYFALQDVEEVWYPSEQIRTHNTPKQILALLRQEFESGWSDPYTMGIYHYSNGSLSMGHAITPYDVVDRGGGIYWLYVYDNNYPGESLHIRFDTNNDTWYYTSDYQGTASTQNLDLTRISYRNQEPFTPPFATSAAAVEFFLANGGDMMITNAAGQRFGYDPVSGRMVNEIPDAHVIPLRGSQSRIYRVPLQEPHELYTVTVSGQAIAGEVRTALVMVGPGYVVGFEDMHLQPGQVLEMSLSADGEQLTFEGGQTDPMPRVFR